MDEDTAHTTALAADVEGREDPLDYPCDACGAEAGEECREHCTAAPA